MSRIWEAHTVVPKSLRTIPDVGIQRVVSQPGLFLGASLSSRSKLRWQALASLPSEESLAHEQGVRTVRPTRAHICVLYMRMNLVSLIKRTLAMKIRVP